MALVKEEKVIGNLVQPVTEPIRIYRYYDDEMSEKDITEHMRCYQLTREQVLKDKTQFDEKLYNLVREICEKNLLDVFTNHIFEIHRSQFGRTFTFIIRPIGNDKWEDRSEFTLTQMINCCGIVVSTRTEVGKSYRRKGVSGKFQIIKEQVSKLLGYSMMLSTVLENNEAEIKSIESAGWKCVDKFKNSRTQNKIRIYTKLI
jgi:hypothetical protein